MTSCGNSRFPSTRQEVNALDAKIYDEQRHVLDFPRRSNDFGDFSSYNAEDRSALRYDVGSGQFEPSYPVYRDDFFNKGDMMVGTGPDNFSRFPLGNGGDFLKVDPTSPTGFKWEDPGYEYLNKGDLLVGTGPSDYSRLALGNPGQFLTADPATATGFKWSDLQQIQPGNDIQAETTFGGTSSVGTGNAYARDNHKHGNPSLPTTNVNNAVLLHNFGGTLSSAQNKLFINISGEIRTNAPFECNGEIRTTDGYALKAADNVGNNATLRPGIGMDDNRADGIKHFGGGAAKVYYQGEPPETAFPSLLMKNAAGDGVNEGIAISAAAARKLAIGIGNGSGTYSERFTLTATEANFIGSLKKNGVEVATSESLTYGPVVAETTFGGTSSDGSGTAVARANHKHGNPSIPTSSLNNSVLLHNFSGTTLSSADNKLFLNISGFWRTNTDFECNGELRTVNGYPLKAQDSSNNRASLVPGSGFDDYRGNEVKAAGLGAARIVYLGNPPDTAFPAMTMKNVAGHQQEVGVAITCSDERTLSVQIGGGPGSGSYGERVNINHLRADFAGSLKRSGTEVSVEGHSHGSSELRFKTAVIPLEGVLDRFRQINHIEYAYIKDVEKFGPFAKRRASINAHQAQAVFPMLIYRDEFYDELVVDDRTYSMLQGKATQELADIVDSQAVEIKQLKKMMAAILSESND